jgi:large subunit ribosomal protein L9
MKVILLDDVAKVGRRGEVRDVSDGYARNYLIPKKLALSATAGNLKNLDHIKRQQDAKAARIKTDAESLRARIEALAYEDRRQASEEGKLFGSVTSQDVAEYLAQQGVKVERRRILLDEPIKSLGEHTVSVRLHQDVVAQLRVNVVRAE